MFLHWDLEYLKTPSTVEIERNKLNAFDIESERQNGYEK